MRKRNGSVLGVICIISLVIMVCIKAEAQEILHLGASVPFSFRIGIELKKILEMNADLLNKSGGLTVGGKTYMVKYHIYDDKFDADAGRAAHERLVFEDKVKFVVGTFFSGSVLASLRITEPNKIPIFSNASSDKLLAPDIKYFVHTMPTKAPNSLSKLLTEIRPNIKTVLICVYDNEFGHTVGPYMEKAYKTYGLTTFPTIYFKQGLADFSPIATKTISLKPDHFIAAGFSTGGESIQVVKALRDAGYSGTVELAFLTQPVLDDIVAKVGKKGADGIFSLIIDPTFPGIKNKPAGAAEFRENYERYYGKWEVDGLQWMDCWYAWLAAVRKANSLDPDRVIAAIDQSVRVLSPFGVGKFFTRPDLGNNRYCDYVQPIRLGETKNGKIEFLTEKDADYWIDALEKIFGMKITK